MPRFRPHEHLRTPADFKRVYERRASAADNVLLVYVVENDLGYSRLGLSVSKKFDKRATRRNRRRRVMREAFRLGKHELPTGLDMILIPRGKPSDIRPEEVWPSLLKLTRQAVRRLRPRPADSGGPSAGPSSPDSPPSSGDTASS